jgi:hypothetical protein
MRTRKVRLIVGWCGLEVSVYVWSVGSFTLVNSWPVILLTALNVV